MIKLTLSPDTQPLTRVFSKHMVVIGNASSECDLTLPEEFLEPVHVKIIEEGGNYLIVNQANDPFVTLNGIPFGKKTLRNKDLIQIGRTTILFEGIQKEMLSTAEEIPALLEQKIAETLEEHFHTAPLAQEHPTEPLPIEIKKAPTVEAPKVAAKKEETPVIPKAAPPNPYQYQIKVAGEPLQKKKTADYILTEFDEENEGWKFEKENPQAEEAPKGRWNWKLIIGIALTILFILLSIAASLYTRVSDKSGEEELRAAEGVSDVSMALTYARINHIKPQKHNWSDPDFLKNNLAAVLTSDYPSLANIDSHGQFCNCNYILRIYTSSDFSHFVVIAQPTPSLKQWLIPKGAIVVDSALMELRLVDNIKALNRLLVDPNVLDGDSGDEVTEIIKEGQIIPLSSLAAKRKDKWFSPPKALSIIRPGAQNLIYNAPRYYHVGEGIVKRALNMMENPGRSHEINRLKQEIELMANLPNMIIYSAWGMQMALDGQKALATFVPQGKFLTAYFQYNSKDEVVSSYLLMDDENEQLAFKQPESSVSAREVESARNRENGQSKFAESFDDEHPLIYQLQGLSNARKQVLKPIGDELAILTAQNNDGMVGDFNVRFQKLSEDYAKRNKEQQEIILKELNQVAHEHRQMPAHHFIFYVKAAGLESFIKEILRLQVAKLGSVMISKDKIADQLQKIQSSQNFDQLKKAVSETFDLLNLEKIPDLDLLIPAQADMRAAALMKMNQFLILPYGSSEQTFSAEDRESLISILKMIWMTDQEEYSFYLNEFDLIQG